MLRDLPFLLGRQLLQAGSGSFGILGEALLAALRAGAKAFSTLSLSPPRSVL